MRILLDARYLDGTYSGIGTYSRFMVEHLSKIDDKNEYYVLVRPKFKESISVGKNFEFISIRPQVVSFQTLFSLHRAYEELKPDIVHSFAPFAPIFWTGPLLVTLHDLQPLLDPDFHSKRSSISKSAYRMFYRWAYPAVLSQAKWIICVSSSTRDEAARLFPWLSSKFIVSHEGIDQTVERPSENQVQAIQQKLGQTNPYFLYYGSTRPNKNLVRLVKAYAQFRAQTGDALQKIDLMLVLKRDRFFEDVEKVIEAQQLQDCVRVVDPLNSGAMQALLAGAHAMLFPTKYEGFGLPPLEAMKWGVPVLASKSGSLPEICDQAAYLVDPDDIDDIATGIQELASNDSLRSSLSVLGPERASQFKWETSAGVAHDIYRLLF